MMVHPIQYFTKKLIIILPTSETDKKSEKLLYYYNPQPNVISDKEALKMDLSEFHIIARGTMDGNLWLKKYKATFPFSIYQKKVVVDKVYSGNKLRLISVAPHPYNKNKGLLIYTAQNTFETLGIDNVTHGNNDFTLVRRNSRLGSGNYENEK